VSAPGRFAGQVVVVTGAASGIGRATAEAFAAEGGGSPGSTCGPATVPDGTTGVACDVGDAAAVGAAFARVRAELGPVDVLVAAAGVAFRRQEVQDRVLANVEAAMGGGALAPLRAASTLDDERWDRALRVALYGTFHCCREALRDMEDRGSGAIVALGSVYGVMGCDIMPEYGAAKGGVIAFAKGLAREVLPAGVRVNVVAPGAVRTPMLEEGLDERLAAMGRPACSAGTGRRRTWSRGRSCTSRRKTRRTRRGRSSRRTAAC
jgi:3-oxoacyl-[acyl-carrier protein] reductase